MTTRLTLCERDATILGIPSLPGEVKRLIVHLCPNCNNPVMSKYPPKKPTTPAAAAAAVGWTGLSTVQINTDSKTLLITHTPTCWKRLMPAMPVRDSRRCLQLCAGHIRKLGLFGSYVAGTGGVDCEKKLHAVYLCTVKAYVSGTWRFGVSLVVTSFIGI